MIDERKEYQELLTNRIAEGNYYSYSKAPSYITKIKADEKRANPPSNSMLILRHFLFEGINDWSSISIEERKERIHKAEVAFLCWLGDQDSFEEGKELLKDEFSTIVKDNKGAYQMLLDTYKDAAKLKESRPEIIKTLKDKQDFYQKFYSGCFSLKNYHFDTLIYNAIALGPIRHTIVAFKKNEIKEMVSTIVKYHYIGNYALDVRGDNWCKTLLLTSYLKAHQYNHYDGELERFVDVSNADIVTLLQSTKCLKVNGGKDPRYNVKILAAQPIEVLDRDGTDDKVDYAFGFERVDMDGSNNLWKPNPTIAKYVYIFNDEKDIGEDYIYFTNVTGPDFLNEFLTQLTPYL